ESLRNRRERARQRDQQAELSERERARNRAQQAELDRLIGQVEQLEARMRRNPSSDPRNEIDILRQQARRAGRQDYSIEIPLHDPVTVARVEKYFRDATAEFLTLPGSETLRRR